MRPRSRFVLATLALLVAPAALADEPKADRKDAILVEIDPAGAVKLDGVPFAGEVTAPALKAKLQALRDKTGRKAVVLVFYRGAWCPYCNLQLRAFQAALADIRAAGARLVAISPQTPDNSLTLAEQAELAFPVLSDVGNAVARGYGLVFELDADDRAVHSGVGIDLAAFNGEDSWELPAPAVFVVDADGTIRHASVAGDYRWRVGPDEVLAALRA